MNPAHEEPEIAWNEAPLDSSDDDAEDESELIEFADCLPAGMQVAPPPSQEQLVFKSGTGKELKGKRIMYNWAGIG